MRSTAPPQLRPTALQILTLALGCLGLAWGMSNLASGAASDDFHDVEARLLRFESFSATTASRILQSAAAERLSVCDSSSQRALLLLEIPLADAALRSGARQDYDQHSSALQGRVRRLLSCSPRDSFGWLVTFGLEVEHGALNDHSFDLLAMSYDTSPNEAWVAVRRNAISTPVVLFAPEAVRQKILSEFQDLVRNGFLDIPAHSYLTVPAPARALLQSRIDELDSASQKAFSEALLRLRS